MTAYRTCWNCAKDRNQCATRAKVRTGLAGLHVTSVAFKCEERMPKFLPGERVVVTWPVIPDDWHHNDGISLENWPATVSCETDGKFVIRVDDVESDCGTPASEYVKNTNRYCKVSASKLEKLDEPSVAVCAYCREVGGEGFKGCGELNGETKLPSYRPAHPDCLRATGAA